MPSASAACPCVRPANALLFWAMLYFDIRMIESGAQTVDGQLSAGDPIWEDEDVLPSSAVHVEGRLSYAGPGRFYFTGQFSGEAVASCRRCLTDVTTTVNDSLSGLFAEVGLDEAEEDDVFPLNAGARAVDLRPVVREAWLLAAPAFVTCRDECQGLCPICGVDRNVETCACASNSTDSRWDALRALRDSSS